MKRDRPVPLVLLPLLFLPVLFGCGDDEAETAPGAMLAGPYASAPSLTDETRRDVPAGLDAIGDADGAFFYWYAREASGGTLRFEVRAEATALEPGTVIHREEEPVPETRVQGVFSIDPHTLNHGGTRTEEGRPRWLEGVYSVRIFVGEEELAAHIFNVQ